MWGGTALLSTWLSEEGTHSCGLGGSRYAWEQVEGGTEHRTDGRVGTCVAGGAARVSGGRGQQHQGPRFPHPPAWLLPHQLALLGAASPSLQASGSTVSLGCTCSDQSPMLATRLPSLHLWLLFLTPTPTLGLHPLPYIENPQCCPCCGGEGVG